MNMLTPKDLQLIGEEMGKIIEQNINPQFEAIDQRFEKLEEKMDDRFNAVNLRFDATDRRIDRLDGKTNVLINTLQNKEVITENDKRRILS